MTPTCTHTTDLEPAPRRSRRRLAGAALVAGTGLLLTGTGVYAALSATAFNTTAEAVTSGTLKLTLADNGAGFSQAVSNVAPGDVVNRYVTLTNGGTLDGKDLKLGVADATPSLLTSDATKGLRVTVSSCPTAWTATSGACSGTPTVVLASTALSSLRTTAAAFTTTTVVAGAVQHLQLSLTLPDQVETTVNGLLPNPTIQGLTAALTWTFSENQRAATVLNS